MTLHFKNQKETEFFTTDRKKRRIKRNEAKNNNKNNDDDDNEGFEYAINCTALKYIWE